MNTGAWGKVGVVGDPIRKREGCVGGGLAYVVLVAVQQCIPVSLLQIMYIARQGAPFAPVYFIAFMVFGSTVMVNLFIAVVLVSDAHTHTVSLATPAFCVSVGTNRLYLMDVCTWLRTW